MHPNHGKPLSGDKDFKAVKDFFDSSRLIKLIEKIYYNYQSQEFAPLSGWEVMDQLCSLK